MLIKNTLELLMAVRPELVAAMYDHGRNAPGRKSSALQAGLIMKLFDVSSKFPKV